MNRDVLNVAQRHPRDRLGALEHAAKYGLGALKETTVEEVTERLVRTLDIFASQHHS